jgi:ABC-type nitrate/sulfonate/bicarbonate transport system substrate-binding protein
LNVKALTRTASAIIVVVIVIIAAAGAYYAYATFYATPTTTVSIATAFGAPDYSDVASVYAITVEAPHYGVNMSEQIYTGTATALAALLAGKADVLDTGAPAVLSAISKGGNGSNIIAFAAGESAQDLNLVCQGNITSINQLVTSSTPSNNPTIGVTTLGDTSQYPIAVWMTNNHINPNDANWVTVAGSAARLAQLLSGKSQCGGVDIGGTLLLLSQPGNKYHLLEPYASMLPKGSPLEVLFTTKAFMASHKTQLEGIVKAFMAANRYFQNEQNYLSYAPTIVQNVNASSFAPAYRVVLQQNIFDPNAPWNPTIAASLANLTATYKINGVTTFMEPSTWADFSVYNASLSAMGTATTTADYSTVTT